MSNFSYLSTRPAYSLFANSAIEAEKAFSTLSGDARWVPEGVEPAKWVYAADKTITMPRWAMNRKPSARAEPACVTGM